MGTAAYHGGEKMGTAAYHGGEKMGTAAYHGGEKMGTAAYHASPCCIMVRGFILRSMATAENGYVAVPFFQRPLEVQ